MSLPLALVEKGARVMIKSINLDKITSKRLRDMGINKNLEISIVSRNSNGSVVINTGSFRLALDALLTKKLTVLPL